MLHASKLGYEFWLEAVATTVYLKNRSPTKAVEKMTPYEAWFGKKPSLGHLKTFGCTAYAYIPKAKRYKLDWKSKKCVAMRARKRLHIIFLAAMILSPLYHPGALRPPEGARLLRLYPAQGHWLERADHRE